MYRLALRRPARPEEVKSWADAVDARPSVSHLAGIVDAIATSEEARAVAVDDFLPGFSRGLFTQLAHEIILQRGALPREIVCWDHLLEHGRARSILLARLFQNSAGLLVDRGTTVNDPSGSIILGTDARITIGDWRRKVAEIKGRSTVATPVRQSYSRFPLLSGPGVVVTAIASLYKGGAFISRFMANICSQSIFKDYCELIIVDSNSPEKEHETIKRYMDRFPNIRYIRIPERIGVYEAWNLAVSEARGKYITNTNVDDLRRGDSFELQAATLDNIDFADVVYQDFYYSFDHGLGFKEVAAIGIKSNLPVVCSNNLISFNSPHHAPMWRRSLHEEIGPFDTAYRSAGDWEFWIRCAVAGKQFYKINEPHAAYFVNPAGVSTQPGTQGIVEGKQILRIHARKLVSEHLVSSSDRFMKEIRDRSELNLDICGADCSSEEWRYAAVQRAMRQISAASRSSVEPCGPLKTSVAIRPLKLIVDGIIFQIANSLTAGLWASVLPNLLNFLLVPVILLDRGNAPDLRGMERIPFPSYGRHCHAQDSLLLDKICQLQAADVFLSTYYTTPLLTPSLSVIYDMIPERLGWALSGRIWREKELAISHGRRHLCLSDRTRLDLLGFYPELERSAIDVGSCGVASETVATNAFALEESLRTQFGLTRPFYILMGSRIHGQDCKTLRLLFEAIRRMRNVDFDVLCVGNEPELEQWSTELAPTGCRFVCAELNDRDLALAYRTAAALIYPSLYEGFAIPVFEAISCGCPVITTNLGGLTGVTESAAAYVIEGHSISQMTEALGAVRAPKVRQRLGRAGQDQVAELRPSNFADALARNISHIGQESEKGKFADFYIRWSKLRTLQSEVDIAT
jgi:glycosyltransferase involved in cell wall biosynthesis